jgi:large subunit ribosomal protein L49
MELKFTIVRRQDIAAASVISRLANGKIDVQRLLTFDVQGIDFCLSNLFTMALTHMKALKYLPFLRPLALPRVSILQRFLSTSASSNPRSSAASSSPAQSTPSAPESTSKPISSHLPYRVERTPSSNLPIYVYAKSGGTRKETRLRKIEGDIDTLRVQLRDALKVDDKDIVINRLTQHIVIKVSHD